MTLASMIELSEDALICDLAETYHILDYRSLPLQLVATLSAGLRENSRIMLLAAGSPVSQDTLLLATIADRIEYFRYGFADKKNRGDAPVSLVKALYGEGRKKKSGVTSFRSGSDLEAALARLRGE